MSYDHAEARDLPAEEQKFNTALDALKGILLEVEQDFWYETVRRADPIRHAALLKWIVEQEACDFSVAALVFFRSEVADAVRNRRPLPECPDATALHAVVLQNWAAGRYRSHEIDCYDELRGWAKILRRYVEAVPAERRSFAVPERFLDPFGGRAFALPTFLSPAHSHDVWVIFNALGFDVPPRSPNMPAGWARLTASLKAHMPRFGTAPATS